MTFTYDFPCFDLDMTARSGQCFRMVPRPDGWFQVISQGQLLRLSQEGSSITFDCPEESLSFWLHYFDCDCDYQAILDSVDPKDAYLLAASRAGRGIRILHQDPWEMIITFVISQQKTIPKIRELVEALSSRFGSPIPGAEGCFSFPTPGQLSKASLEELLALKLGYRAKYIHRLSQEAAQGILDLEYLNTLAYQDAMDYLTGFYGIGKKVANCICLFGLHHIDAFPVDTWIQKILMEHYYDESRYQGLPASHLYDVMIQEHFGRYTGCAGIMQQYIFFYERSIVNQKG